MSGPRKAWVVGAGLAGLSAAVQLTRAGVKVRLVEAAPRAGGRCRSYFDEKLGQVIDNGNHFVFSGNQAVARFRGIVGGAGTLAGPDKATFAFHDLADDARWQMKVNAGPLPWWVLNPANRAPGTTLAQHAGLARLALERNRSVSIGERMAAQGQFWRRVVEPMMLAVLNCPAEQGSAWLAGRFLRESFVRGGQACRTLVALPTLEAAFVTPAVDWLRLRGVEPIFSTRLRGLEFADGAVSALDLAGGREVLHAGDAVVLAVPPWVAADLVPGLTVPTRHSAIVNLHYALAPPPGAPLITALLGATGQWVVAHDNRISVTISGADALVDRDREALASEVWGEVARTLGLTGPMPAWQVVKEKRATFAATAEQDALRPPAQTQWPNLFLAGDWVQNGLPATIEGALRSGEVAARLALDGAIGYGARP